jgi:hypothetical protein
VIDQDQEAPYNPTNQVPKFDAVEKLLVSIVKWLVENVLNEEKTSGRQHGPNAKAVVHAHGSDTLTQRFPGKNKALPPSSVYFIPSDEEAIRTLVSVLVQLITVLPKQICR